MKPMLIQRPNRAPQCPSVHKLNWK